MTEIKEKLNVKKGKIMENLLIDNQFKDKDVIIRRWDGEENNKNFISEIKKNNIHYIGLLNSNLEKDNYALLSLPSGEKYFGVYTQNLRDKHGLYQFPDKLSEDGNKTEREFFFGLFKDGLISNRGVYLWIRENKDVPMFDKFEDADFSCFIGELNEKHFINGTYLTKDGENYYVYHGGFNEKNEKEGENAFFYNSSGDELMYGKIVKNKFIDGYLGIFDDDGNLKGGLFVTYDDAGEITSYKQKEELPEAETIFQKMFDFRNIIMDKDYFGEVFESFKKICNYINEKVNIEAFDNKDEFPKLMNISFEFNKIKIKEDIDSVLSKYQDK